MGKALAESSIQIENLPAPPAYGPFGLADLLTSGETGDALVGHLRRQFGDLTREDFYLGLRVAVSIWVASDLELQMEREAATRALEVMKLDLDSATIELDWLRRQVGVNRETGAWLRPTTSTTQVMHG